MVIEGSVAESQANRSEHWVSARLEPCEGHSVQELQDLLGPFAWELRIVNPQILAYEGEEEALSKVETIARVHILPYQRFSRRYL